MIPPSLRLTCAALLAILVAAVVCLSCCVHDLPVDDSDMEEDPSDPDPCLFTGERPKPTIIHSDIP